jgi:hypothetical protein
MTEGARLSSATPPVFVTVTCTVTTPVGPTVEGVAEMLVVMAGPAGGFIVTTGLLVTGPAVTTDPLFAWPFALTRNVNAPP